MNSHVLTLGDRSEAELRKSILGGSEMERKCKKLAAGCPFPRPQGHPPLSPPGSKVCTSCPV